MRMPTLRAVLVTPLSGPLARFGAAGAAALRLWATRASGLGAPWTAVGLEVVDARPAAGAAMRAAAARRPDLLFGPYGSGPAVAALAATGRTVWNHGGASGRLRRPVFGHAVNVPAPAATSRPKPVVHHRSAIRPTAGSAARMARSVPSK